MPALASVDIPGQKDVALGIERYAPPKCFAAACCTPTVAEVAFSFVKETELGKKTLPERELAVILAESKPPLIALYSVMTSEGWMMPPAVTFPGMG